MARFRFFETPLPGVLVVERQQLEDSRGFLSRFYCADEFKAAGFAAPVVQINQTLTRRKGTVRGMHFQRPPSAEAKLVTCLRGEVFDVAVDLRRGSPTFLRWHAQVLSSATQRSLLVPEGCAHGFQTLTDDCELLYLHTAAYDPAAEGAVNAVDPRLHIAWPLAITDISERDRSHPLLSGAFEGLDL